MIKSTKNETNQPIAILDMINILIDKEKTILELAEINDKNYFFVNEKK